MTRDRERLLRAFRPPPAHYDVRETVPFAVTAAHRALRRFLVADRWDLGLNEGRDLVLLEIGRLNGAATPKRLRESLGMSATSLSTVLRRSVEAGYVRRERDPEDGRLWRLALTCEGEGISVPAAGMWRNAEATLEEELTPSDVVWLRSLAQRARSVWLDGATVDPAGDEPGR